MRMIAVGVGSGINNNELMEIADGKRENVVHVDKFDELFRNENNVLFASCEPGKSAIRDFVCWVTIFCNMSRIVMVVFVSLHTKH